MLPELREYASVHDVPDIDTVLAELIYITPPFDDDPVADIDENVVLDPEIVNCNLSESR